ncbi:MAG: protease pro-enzyme activation domain-containing protein, partial [Terriglobales bacterium]
MQHSNSPLHSSALPLLALLFVTALTLPAFAQKASVQPTSTAASVPDHITQPIYEAQLVTLQRNTRPEANSRNDRGAVSDGFDIEHIFLLLQRSPEQEQELDKLIDELNDRTSPNFHHWLSADEFGQRFGVASEDIDTITNWLNSHSFRVNRVYPSRILIDFSGTAGQIREAFHTEIHNLDVNGAPHISNISDPQIPAALAPVVKGIFSLNDFKPHPMYKPATQYTLAGCASSTDRPTELGTCYAMTPQDTQTIYNLNPLYTAGISGQGQTIVLVEDSDTYNGAGDWNTYRSTFGLASAFPEGTYTQVHPGGCTDPGTTEDDGEAAIDVEVASAVAPSAAIELISCASGTVTFGGLIALQNLINESGTPPAIVSVSYGVCEAFNGNGGNAAFYDTYQQAASEGVSVFGASGDEGPSSCSSDFSIGSEYDVASLGVSGWTDTPYNVAVGGTDFEDAYNSKEGGAPLSTYWSATNSGSYGSALSYIPEMPWDDSCANVLISEVAHSSFTTYGSSGTCNTSPFDTISGYLIAAAGSGGASNCATGAGGTDQGEYGISDPQCQGWAKPSWQSGTSLTGGKAVYGQPSDGVRDIPDISMFAANGIWGHYEIVCWSDPNYSADGSASCSGAPSTWSGFGGTSVASPTMAAIQALVNQKTGESWGNPNPIYYQIAQNEYGAAGGSFLGSSCNSSGSGGPGSGCVFNDVTQGDIDLACEDNGTTEEAHCYKPSGTRGVDSTDVITAATVINGGSGYTTAPTCTIAGPTNVSPYLSPTGTTLWAGGTQATCTAAVNSGTTTAKWTVAVESADAVGDQIIVGPDTYTLTGSSTTTIASNLATAINSPTNPVATATVSSSSVTITATTAGAAGNFTVSFGTATLLNAFYVYITNTTLGEGPNYVSGITLTVGGTGYQPETPITLTGGGGTGAIAVANTSFGTAASTYQPAYGAAPGYDLATGLGSVNATNLVNSSAWLPSGPPGIYSPTPGSTLTGYSATVQWYGYPGATAYWLDVGKEPGGNEYYQSGSLPISTLSQTVDSLPEDGSPVWARWYYMLSGTWQHIDYSYTAFGATGGAIATLKDPTPNGSTLPGSSVTFIWQGGTDTASNYWIDVGNSKGGNSYYQSGKLPTSTTSVTVNNLPINGSEVYVTLYSLVNGVWLNNPYYFYGGSSCLGAIATPTAGSTLPSTGAGTNGTGGATQYFTWTATSAPGCSTQVTGYWLDVGKPGAENFYYQSGQLLANTTHATASPLPTAAANGPGCTPVPPQTSCFDPSSVTVTLWTLIGGAWQSNT